MPFVYKPCTSNSIVFLKTQSIGTHGLSVALSSTQITESKIMQEQKAWGVGVQNMHPPATSYFKHAFLCRNKSKTGYCGQIHKLLFQTKVKLLRSAHTGTNPHDYQQGCKKIFEVGGFIVEVADFAIFY